MEKKITVIGGVNVDIKGFSRNTILGGDSNPGRVSWSAGGVAGNIASVLAALGAQVQLCSVLGNDPWGDFLLRRSRERGISTDHIIIRKGGSSGAYLCLLQNSGELHGALSDMELLDELGAGEVDPWIAAMNDAGMVVVDANLPPPVLERLLGEARRRALPVVAEPVSAAKAPRLLPFLGDIDFLTPNELEYRVLQELIGPQERRGSPEKARPGKLSSGPCFLVSRGAEGVRIIPGALDLPAIPAAVADVSGAGDAFTAGFCYALAAGSPLQEAVRWGLAAASLNLESGETVRPDLSRELCMSRLQEGYPEKRTTVKKETKHEH